jgi:hypothetical protein
MFLDHVGTKQKQLSLLGLRSGEKVEASLREKVQQLKGYKTSGSQ